MNAGRYYNTPEPEPVQRETVDTGDRVVDVSPEAIHALTTATAEQQLSTKRLEALVSIRQSLAAHRKPADTVHRFEVHGVTLTSSTRIEHHHDAALTRITVTV